MHGSKECGCDGNRRFVNITTPKPLVVGVAQLVRAPDCGSGGRGFETRHPPQ